MTTARHVIFGTGAIGLATYDALRRRGESVRLVNRSGHARVPDNVEVIGGDARDSAFTRAVAQGAAVLYQTLNPPYHQWTAEWPALQAGVLAAAQATGARRTRLECCGMSQHDVVVIGGGAAGLSAAATTGARN